MYFNLKFCFYYLSLFLLFHLKSNAQTDSLAHMYASCLKTFNNKAFDSAQNFALRLEKTATQKKLVTYAILAKEMLAFICMEKQERKQSFEYQFQILKLCNDDSLIKRKARALNNIGALYFDQKQFEQARDFLKQEITYREILKDSVKLANNYMNLTSVYRNLKQFDSVYFYLQKAGSIAGKISKPTLLANYNNLLATFFYTQYQNSKNVGFLDSAIYYYNKALFIWEGRKDWRNTIKPITNLGYVYQIKKDYNKALTYFLKAEKIVDSLNYFEEKVTLYGNIAETYCDVKKYYESTIYFRKLQTIKDSLQKTELKEYAVNLDKQYQLETKSKTILQQKLELEQKNNRINQQQKQLYLYLLLFIVLLVIVIAVLVYINFNKKLHKKIEEAKEKFFVNIMHEIRTPLSMIQAPLKALKPKITDEEGSYYISLAEKNSVRLNELMSQMLEVSKIDSDTYKLNMAMGNLDLFLKELTEGFQKNAVEKNIHFVSEINAPKQTLVYDKDALEKILSNLLSNAIKYTPSHGAVGFVVNYEESDTVIKLHFDVWDTGFGIPKNEQDKLFTRFFRSKNTNKQTKGVGIGLSLVKDLVNAYKGKISFVSEENKGSKFTVDLSLQLAEQTVNEKQIIVETDKPLVLVVEDDEDISTFLISFLQSKNYQVLNAPNGNVAKAILKNTIPDLIVTDLMMEELDGLSFIKQIKADKGLNHIPVIVLSAKSNQKTRVEVLAAGAQAFLSKPFLPDELFSVIDNQLVLINQLKKEFQIVLKNEAPELTAEQKFSGNEPYTKKLFAFIFNHLDNPDLSVEFLADLMATNRSHFQRKIKHLTGYSPSEIIKLIRLEKAKEFLLAKKGNITEVAYMCGFSSQSYFTKCFTEHFGKSPSTFS